MGAAITNSPKEIFGVQPAGAAADAANSEKSEGTPHNEAEARRIRVFLMPGVFYGQPTNLGSMTASELLNLARFRYALRDQIHFVLIGYPDWREMIATKADFDTIVTFALEEILAQCSDGIVYLAGYSFGGLVAFATAHRLVQAGRRVAFLGLLDTRLPAKREALKAIRNLRRCIIERDSTPLLRLILKTLVKFRIYALLKIYMRFCIRIGSRRIDAQLHDILRSHAVSGWRPNALAVPTFFFRTDDDDTPQRHDCGWSALCSPLTVVQIGGDHRSMLIKPNINRVCASFLEALRAVAANSARTSGGRPKTCAITTPSGRTGRGRAVARRHPRPPAAE
jgi:thioesterase domain-containing protein